MDDVAAWLDKNLDYRFDDPALLALAMTHRSATGASNERLEFLGDAVLDFVISHAVFDAWPEAEEGDLSRLRAWLVNDVALAEISGELGLGEYLRLGSGERKTGGHRRASILADALEALFGAVYLDRGYDAAEQLILAVYSDRLARLPAPEELKDPKTRLQEALQAIGEGLPEYTMSEVTGKPHRRRFTVTCRVPGLDLESTGNGSSRRAAEQSAARQMLEALRQPGVFE